MEKTNFDKLIKNIQDTTNSIDSRNNKAYINNLQDSFKIENKCIYINKETKEKVFTRPENICEYDTVYEEIYIPQYITILNPVNNTYIEIPKYIFNNNKLQSFDESVINIKTELDELKNDKISHIKKMAHTIKNMVLYRNYKNIGINGIIVISVKCNKYKKCDKCIEIELLLSCIKDILLYIECDYCILLADLIENIFNENIIFKKDNNSLDIELKVKTVNTIGSERITAFLQ
jgi:hypothetical protein